MGEFGVSYVGGGVVDEVKKVDRIKNFANLTQPYNKMLLLNVPAIAGIYELEYETPDEEVELLAFVVTCSGYGENDYYNLYVNNQKWFDTWFLTEVKEGLYIGTSTYVHQLEPKTKIKLQFLNITGTAKKVWLGVRMLRNPIDESDFTPVIVNTTTPAVSVGDITPPTTETNN